MKYRIVLLVLECILVSFVVVLTTCDSSNSAVQTPQSKEFIKSSGFKGDYTSADDGRLFTKLSGTFNLPMPKDSLALQANMDKIAHDLSAIYQKQGANYTLKRISYDNKYKSCQYIQFWDNFYLDKQPYYLLISYNSEKGTYSVHNNLYMKPITIPDKIVSLITFKRIYNFVTDVSNLNTDLSAIQKDYVSTDTLKTLYEYYNKFNDSQYSGIYLNLYPAAENSKSQEYTLQWNYQDFEMGEMSYFADAASGNLTGSLLKYWRDKVPCTIAAINFIADNNLSGNCRSFIQDGRISFEINKVSIGDTLSFHQYTDKYIPAILKMYKQLGEEFQLKYYETFISADGKVFSFNYKQVQRYPLLGEDETRFRLDFVLYRTTGQLIITSMLLAKPIAFPKQIISPKAIAKISFIRSKFAPDSFLSKLICKMIAKNKVDINTIPYANQYNDYKLKRTARLYIIPNVDDDKSSKVPELVWNVSWHNNNVCGTYNPVSGIPRNEFRPVGFGLPSIKVDFRMIAKTIKFKLIQFIHYLKWTIDFSDKTAGKYDRYVKFSHYYKGMRLIVPCNAWQDPVNIELKYYEPIKESDNLYYLKPQNYKMPEIIISPQSALHILEGRGNFNIIRTELANYLKTGNPESEDIASRDYPKEELRYIPPPSETGSGDFAKGFFTLCLYPYKVKNTDNRYVYKLIWDIQGYYYKIDAVTGEKLAVESERSDEVMI